MQDAKVLLEHLESKRGSEMCALVMKIENCRLRRDDLLTMVKQLQLDFVLLFPIAFLPRAKFIGRVRDWFSYLFTWFFSIYLMIFDTFFFLLWLILLYIEWLYLFWTSLRALIIFIDRLWFAITPSGAHQYHNGEYYSFWDQSKVSDSSRQENSKFRNFETRTVSLSECEELLQLLESGGLELHVGEVVRDGPHAAVEELLHGLVLVLQHVHQAVVLPGVNLKRGPRSVSRFAKRISTKNSSGFLNFLARKSGTSPWVWGLKVQQKSSLPTSPQSLTTESLLKRTGQLSSYGVKHWLV